MTYENQNSKAPSHTAYHVREYQTADGESKGSWTRIGSVWSHGDGKGFSVKLDCVPVDGEITIRANEPRDNG